LSVHWSLFLPKALCPFLLSTPSIGARLAAIVCAAILSVTIKPQVLLNSLQTKPQMGAWHKPAKQWASFV
jgi:hypothetical protein